MVSPSALTIALNICTAQDKDVLGKPQPLLTTVTNETPNQSGDIFDPWQRCGSLEGNSWKKSIQCYKTLSLLLLLNRRTASARQRRQKMQSQDMGVGWKGLGCYGCMSSGGFMNTTPVAPAGNVWQEETARQVLLLDLLNSHCWETGKGFLWKRNTTL